MKAAVLHVNTANKLATSPTMRIAKFVADTLRIPLAYDVPSAQAVLAAGSYDILFVKYGMIKFSEQREEAMKLYAGATTIVNLENDYSFKPDPRFGKANGSYTAWTNVSWQDRPDHFYTNWNVLTWAPPAEWEHPWATAPVEEAGLLYWGAFRPDRFKSFSRFFKDAAYPITISTYRGRKDFSLLNPNIKFIGANALPKNIRKYGATLYIEDETSHTLFTSPANRFYEALQNRLAILVDEAAVPTLNKAGFAVPLTHVVRDAVDVAGALNRVDEIRRWQCSYWHRDFRIDLQRQISQNALSQFGWMI